MAKQKENFLDYTPRRNSNLLWRKKGTLVEVDVEHRGFINRIAQKFFHRPRISHIALDEFGSFIWPREGFIVYENKISSRTDKK